MVKKGIIIIIKLKIYDYENTGYRIFQNDNNKYNKSIYYIVKKYSNKKGYKKYNYF